MKASKSNLRLDFRVRIFLFQSPYMMENGKWNSTKKGSFFLLREAKVTVTLENDLR